MTYRNPPYVMFGLLAVCLLAIIVITFVGIQVYGQQTTTQASALVVVASIFGILLFAGLMILSIKQGTNRSITTREFDVVISDSWGHLRVFNYSDITEINLTYDSALRGAGDPSPFCYVVFNNSYTYNFCYYIVGFDSLARELVARCPPQATKINCEDYEPNH